MGRVITVFILLAALGCELSTAPLPAGIAQFNPPGVYERWWSMTEQCSGVTGDFSAVRWYEAPAGVELRLHDGSSVDAYWLENSNRIVLRHNEVFSGDLVRHEMLHALLKGPPGGASHPREMFIDRCQGVVVCIDACTTDDGPAPEPDPAAIHVPQDDVTVSMVMEPETPSSQERNGTFMMVITVTNPFAVPIIADEPTPGCFLCPEATFSYRMSTLSGSFDVNLPVQYPEQRRFAVGESKRFIFDFNNHPSSLYGVAPGPYAFAAAYGGRWTNNVDVTVLP